MTKRCTLLLLVISLSACTPVGLATKTVKAGVKTTGKVVTAPFR